MFTMLHDDDGGGGKVRVESRGMGKENKDMGRGGG